MIQELHEKNGICRFTAELALENEASRKLAERLGFVQVGATSAYFTRSRAG